MPRFRQSFKYSIDDIVYVSWGDKYIEVRIIEIHVYRYGVCYTVKTENAESKVFHDSEIAKSPYALGAKMGRSAK